MPQGEEPPYGLLCLVVAILQLIVELHGAARP